MGLDLTSWLSAAVLAEMAALAWAILPLQDWFETSKSQSETRRGLFRRPHEADGCVEAVIGCSRGVLSTSLPGPKVKAPRKAPWRTGLGAKGCLALLAARVVRRRALGELPRRVALGLGGSLGALALLKRFAIDGPPQFDVPLGAMKGKTVVITGGNTGLGRESAARLARGGATVVLTARSEAKGQRAVEEVSLDLLHTCACCITQSIMSSI